MIRFDVLKSLVPVIGDEPVVCNIGAPSQELYALDGRDTNLHMLGTMGLASSIGFGLAVTQDKPVISIDGDGSVLTNLATLATIANNTQGNFILLIIDNGSYGSFRFRPHGRSANKCPTDRQATSNCERTRPRRGTRRRHVETG